MVEKDDSTPEVLFKKNLPWYKNTNEMLHYNANVFGVKTGTTDNAGECLIILFTENDHPYLFILLGSSDRYADGLKKLQAVHAALQ
jgi:D-alanyl-D-alanine carboxypeptidase (penicillin-binding protein 5/6)